MSHFRTGTEEEYGEKDRLLQEISTLTWEYSYQIIRRKTRIKDMRSSLGGTTSAVKHRLSYAMARSTATVL